MSGPHNDLPAALAAYKAAQAAAAAANEAHGTVGYRVGTDLAVLAEAFARRDDARLAALRAQWRAHRIGIAQQAVADARAAMANVHSTESLHVALAAEFLRHDMSLDGPSAELRGVDDEPEAG